MLRKSAILLASHSEKQVKKATEKFVETARDGTASFTETVSEAGNEETVQDQPTLFISERSQSIS